MGTGGRDRVCALSMAIQFLIIPFYPVWSLLMIALDIAIIFALATYRRDAL